MRLACSTIHYHAAGWPLSRALRDIAEAGFEGVEINLGLRYDPELLAPGAPGRRALEDTGLAPASLIASLFWLGDDSTMSANREIAAQIFDCAGELGVPTVLTATGPWLDDVPRRLAREQLVENLRWLVDSAPAGVEVGLEAVGVPWPHSLWPIHNAETYLEFRAAVSERLKANVDPNNYVRGGEDPAAAIRRLGPAIVGVHLKDVAEDRAGFHNVPAGEGSIDFAACVEALREVGFDRWLVAEDETWDTTQVHDCERISREMHRFYSRLLSR